MKSLIENGFLNKRSSESKDNAEHVVIDVNNISYQEESKLINEAIDELNYSIQTELAKKTDEAPEKIKQFIKRFLEQAKGTTLGGAVIVNHVILALTMMGHKFSMTDHQRLEYLLISYWGMRGGTAALLELTGLKEKAPNVISAYTLTEKNVIRMLAIASFLRKMPINFGINSALQIACSMMVVMDQFLSAKALVDETPDPSGGSYAQIKAYYEAHQILTPLAILKEMGFRAIQMGATTYTAGYALADVFVDANSPIDPSNQEQILMSLALVMSLLGALSVAHPVTTQIANQVRAAEINTGLVLLPLVSLMYDFLPAWFASNSLETGLIAMALVVLIPAALELMVSFWEHQETMDNQNTNKPEDEMRATIEEVIDEDLIDNTPQFK